MTPSTPDASRRRPTGVAGLHHVAVVSRDLARSADFYGRILGLSDIGLGPVPVAPMERPGRLEEARGRWYRPLFYLLGCDGGRVVARVYTRRLSCGLARGGSNARRQRNR